MLHSQLTSMTMAVLHGGIMLQIFEQLAVMTNEMTAEITISEYQQNVNELWEALMGFEMQLVEQLEVCFCCS